ncbi:MAG: glycosyltransferase family 2 protein [bacterium]
MSSDCKYTLDLCNSLPKFDKSVSLVCWAHNEEELIEDFLIRIHNLLEKNIADYEIIVVDDGSTDQTNAIIRRLQEQIPPINLIVNSNNLDVAGAAIIAIKSAKKEYLFWQTIDWSYDITFLRIFLELLKTNDIVAGVRREPVMAVDKIVKPVLAVTKLFGYKHITKRSDTIPKALVSIINYLIIRLLFRIELSDFQNIVFYPTEMLQSIEMEANSSFGNPEFLIKSYWKGASIREVPISFIPRKAGVAKGTRFKAIRSSVSDIFRLWFKWVVLGKRDFMKNGTIHRLNPDEWEKL